MRRHLPRLLLTGALLAPTSLWALGLGEIRLQSALNQPFEAEIELIAPTPEELASLKVGLASPDLFNRYGIDRPAYLSSFDFSVGRSRDGRATIRVRSSRSVTEPFVTLLVQASWSGGRLVREYTVLLDPPVFMPSQPQAPAPVTTPQAGAQTEGRIERPQPRQEVAPAPVPQPQPATQEVAGSEPEPTVAAQPAGLDGEYAVRRNDTLWRIASQINPGSPAVVNRTMIALYRANPTAFDGNINRLRAGSVLRIPDFAEIDAISTAEAAAEVARQTTEWRGALPTEATEPADRLQLVTPAETPTAPSSAPSSSAEVPAEEPAPQTSASATQPAADDRLEVSSPELATAQQNVSEAPLEEPLPGESETAAPEGELPIEETPVAEAEQPAEPAPAPRKRPRAEQPQPEPSFFDRLSEYGLLLIPVGLLVLAALFFVSRRRRSQGASEDSLDSIAAFNYEPPAVRAAATKKREDSFLDMEEPEIEDQDFAEPAPAPVTARRSEPVEAQREVSTAPAQHSIEDTLSSETAVRLDQQDALAEADFHMAYGLYDQAADLVKIAIEREPQRRDLKLKLLEIYFVWGNKDLFLDTARDLYASRDTAPAGEWDKILIMGKQIAPEDSMFQGETGGHVDLVDVNLEGGENRVDVDLFAEPDADQAAGLDLEFQSGEHKGMSGAEADLDFLLDEPKAHDDDDTREIDPLARTQETPTIESPILDRSAATIREKTDKAVFKANGDQTEEISLDDLGLDVNAIDHSGALEETTSLEKDVDSTEIARPLRDDEMTQLAPSLGSMDRTMEAPRVEKFDVESTGTIYIDQVDLSGNDTVEQPRADIDATASLKRPSVIDVDLDDLDGARGASHDTIRQPRAADPDVERFSDDVFSDRGSRTASVDLDVGDPLVAEDRSPTNRHLATTEMELSELEPVTMSEVGTKLDLARAYMDMGDPDGARSILEEVVQEGNPTQKQEANRLLESIR